MGACVCKYEVAVTRPPVGEQSTVMSVSVCLSASICQQARD